MALALTPQTLEVDLVAQLRIGSNRIENRGLAHLGEIIRRKPELTSDALGVTRVHRALTTQHSAQVSVVNTTDLAGEAPESYAPLREEPRQLLGERTVVWPRARDIPSFGFPSDSAAEESFDTDLAQQLS
jgi:hypothetical protein